MGWFSSKQDENNEAYAEGYKDGKEASAIDIIARDFYEAADSNFGPTDSKTSSYREGFKAGSGQT
ncbi:MAG: hypothetical protein ACK5LJ_13975 [Paracoccus sp. (in: a-proteobacteria)]